MQNTDWTRRGNVRQNELNAVRLLDSALCVVVLSVCQFSRIHLQNVLKRAIAELSSSTIL